MILNYTLDLINEIENKDFLEGETRYILHKHDADRAGTHYDLRIQFLDKKDKAISFAIPEATVPTGTRKLLAVTNFIHELWWLDAKEEFDIDDGYGKGHLTTVQSGTMTIHHWDKNNKINFTVKNKKGKLKGTYWIIPANFKDASSKNKGKQYLFFKAKNQK